MSQSNLTRRSLLRLVSVGVCTPAIVRASSLMAVKPLAYVPLSPVERPHAGFAERVFYQWVDGALKGRTRPPVFNGQALTVAEMERGVAYARRWGFLQ